jgi:hypothetical protein
MSSRDGFPYRSRAGSWHVCTSGFVEKRKGAEFELNSRTVLPGGELVSEAQREFQHSRCSCLD